MSRTGESVPTEPRCGPSLQRRGEVIVATGGSPAAHREACRRTVSAEQRLLIRTTGAHAVRGTDRSTTVRFVPDGYGATMAGLGYASGEAPVRAATASGLAVAISNAVETLSGESIDVCIEPLTPLRERCGADGVFWVLRTLALALERTAWSCHIHRPTAGEGSLPDPVAEFADGRVSLDGLDSSAAAGDPPTPD